MIEFPRFDLTGQVALVTGAARGLGGAISLALAHAGADVALGLRNIHAPGDVACEIQTLGRQSLPLQMDMTDLAQISRGVDDTVARFGRLDILVNNAGVAPGNLVEDFRFRSRTAGRLATSSSLVDPERLRIRFASR